MRKLKEQENQLIPLLRQAAQLLLALGHQEIWDSEHCTDELGEFCNVASDKIEANTISDDEKIRLYFIFAPTSEWDDSVWDLELGNKIFGCLEVLYRDAALTK